MTQGEMAHREAWFEPVMSGAVPSWRPAQRREIVLLVLYFALLIALTDIFNFRLGVELLTGAVLLAALLISRMAGQFLRDWWFFLVGLVMWNLSGPIAAQSTFPSHLDLMLNLDRALFLGHDPVPLVQLHLRGAGVTWLDVTTAIAYNLHLAEPYVLGYFLWRLNRPIYFQFAASALILLVVGLITFIVFPAVPPWMAAEKLVRVGGTYYSLNWQDLAALKARGYLHPWAFVMSHGQTYLPGVQNLFGVMLRWHPMPFHGTPIFYVFHFRGDAIAAMPSEHAAFPVLEFLAFARLGKRYALGFALWVLAVLFTVVYLGEHWVTDALAGWLYAVVILLFVRWFVSRRGAQDLRRV